MPTISIVPDILKRDSNKHLILLPSSPLCLSSVGSKFDLIAVAGTNVTKILSPRTISVLENVVDAVLHSLGVTRCNSRSTRDIVGMQPTYGEEGERERERKDGRKARASG